MGFIFGGNTGLTPEEVKRRRDIANAMRPGGQVATTIPQGLSDLAQGIVSAVMGNQADRAERSGQARANKAMAPLMRSLLGGGAAPAPDATLSGGAGSDTLTGGTGGTGIDAPSSRSIVGYSRGSSEPTKPWTDTINATNPGIIDMTGQAGFGYRFGKMPKVNGLVVHHTGGRGDVGGVINTFKQRNFPAQFVMDRDGKIYRTLPDGARGQHMKNGQGIGAGFNNGNTLGIEVIARDNNDWTPAQRQAMAGFAANMGKTYGFDPMKAMFGHGEVNPHKRPDEGMAFVDWFRKTGGKGGPVIVPASGPPPGAPAASEDMSVTQAPLGSQQPMGTAIGTFQQPKVYAPAPGMQPAPDVPAPTPTAVPAPMASAAPMNAYQRMMMQSLGKEAGGLSAPPNRAAMASVMGQGGQPSGGIMQRLFGQGGGAPQPQSAPMAAPAPMGNPNDPQTQAAMGPIAANQASMSPEQMQQGAAQELAQFPTDQLMALINEPWLNDQQRSVVDMVLKKRLEQQFPDPGAAADLQLKQLQIKEKEKSLNTPAQQRTIVIDGVLLTEQPDGSWKPAYSAPKEVTPPKTRTIRRGDKEVTQEWDATTGTFKDVAEGNAFKTTPDMVINNGNAGVKEDKIFERMTTEQDAAKAANAGLASLKQAKEALPGAITGAAANERLALQKLASLFGVGDPQAITDTETFRSAIAPQVAAMLKATVGSTQISNADREFAEKAAGGAITLDAGSIKRLLNIMTAANSEVVRGYNQKFEGVYPDIPENARMRALMGVPQAPKAYASAPGPQQPRGSAVQEGKTDMQGNPAPATVAEVPQWRIDAVIKSGRAKTPEEALIWIQEADRKKQKYGVAD